MTEDKPKPTREESRLRRSAARLAAVQALYRMEMTGASLKTAEVEFEDRWIGAEIEGDQYREADIDFFRALLRGAIEHQSRIDSLTDDALVDRWPLGRVDATLRGLFRAGGSEIVLGLSPPRVAISEFVDVAKRSSANGASEVRERRARPHGPRGAARGFRRRRGLSRGAAARGD